MRVDDLEPMLQAKEVRPSWYSIGTERDNAMCILRQEDRWQVFFSERGQQYDVAEFGSEEEAALHFYAEVVKMVKYR